MSSIYYTYYSEYSPHPHGICSLTERLLKKVISMKHYRNVSIKVVQGSMGTYVWEPNKI